MREKNGPTFMYIGKLEKVILGSAWTPARNAFIFTKFHMLFLNLQFEICTSLFCNQLNKNKKKYTGIMLNFSPNKVTWGPWCGPRQNSEQ